MNNLNFQINNVHQNIVNTIQNSDLPIGVMYFIIKSVYQEIEKLYLQQVMTEQSSLDESDS